MDDSLFNIDNTFTGIAEGVQTESLPQSPTANKANIAKKENPKTNKIKNRTMKNSAGRDNSNITNKTSNYDNMQVTDFSDMTDKDFMRGIVLAEILGKPRSLRKGRW